MNEKENKIRKLLGNEYHLCTHYDEDLNLKYWVLHRHYKDPKICFSDLNKPIMTSDDSTIDDLYNFAKKHHKINIQRAAVMVNLIITYICLIILILNSFIFNSDFIRYFVLGMDIEIIIINLVLWKFDNHNFNVDMLELKEVIKQQDEA